MRHWISFVLLFGIAFHAQVTAPAAPGDLDPSFAGTGKLRVGFNFGEDSANAVAVQADGKLLVAGAGENGWNLDFLLVRYNTDGSLDTSFGSGGMVFTPISSFTRFMGEADDVATAVKVQTDGKIVVAGYTAVALYNNDFAVVRYNTDGSLDTSFGDDGIVTTAVGTGNDIARALILQSDGRIVVAGSSANGSDDDFAVVRYNNDGSPDNSFDGDGKVITPVGTYDGGNAVTIQSDGKILLAGTVSSETTRPSLVVLRYHTNGALDNSFDGDGKAISTSASGGHAIAIQSADPVNPAKILVAGTASNRFAVVRYNLDGMPDISFGTNGITTTPIGDSATAKGVVVVQGFGIEPTKIIVAGFSQNRFQSDFAVVRYFADGTPDTTFDFDGIVTTPIGPTNDRGQAIAIQSGKYVVAGMTEGVNTNADIAVVRYNADGSLDTSFDGDGKRTDAFGNPKASSRSVAVQSNGKIVLAGDCINSLSDRRLAFAMMRLNSDGSPDTSFGSLGRVITAVGGVRDFAAAVALQSDGKIVLGGSSQNGVEGNDFALVRYFGFGLTDSLFGNGGKVTTMISSGDDDTTAVAIQPGGEIVVAGSSWPAAFDSDFAVVRYTMDGSLDATFSGGKVITDISGYDRGNAMAIQPDGKIVVAGQGGVTPSHFAVVRYNTNGSLDLSFDEDGKVITDVGDAGSASALVIQPDGKIVVAGQGDSNFAVVRYQPDGSLDSSFDGDGKVFTDIGSRNSARAVALQSDGRILVAGSASIGPSSDFALVRYNTDGSLDTSYGTGGKVVVDVSNGGDDSASGVAFDANGNAVVTGDANGLFGVVRLLSGPMLATYASWSVTALAGVPPAEAVFAADRDGDGLANGLEYAFLTNPQAPTASPWQVTPGPPGQVHLTYPHHRAASGLQFAIQGTSDLTLPNSWQKITVEELSVMPAGDVDLITVRPPVTDAAQMFYRLQVTFVP